MNLVLAAHQLTERELVCFDFLEYITYFVPLELIAEKR
jgi:hypothetical protein